VPRILLLAATIAFLVASVAGAVLVGSALHLIKVETTTLETIRDAGAVRVAVRPDAPQEMTSAGSLDGFDVEFARYLATSLGVQAYLVPASTEAMLQPSTPDWQIGLPSQPLTPEDRTRFVLSDPYYAWPLYVVTLRSAPATDVAALAGGPVCAAAGSAAEAWLTEDDVAQSALNAVQPPPVAAVHILGDEAACLNELRSGVSRAVVTSRLLRTDVASSTDLQIVGDTPVAYEPRAAIVAREAAGEDELIAEVNRIIQAGLADGTLATLSRQLFGGEDLTVGRE
jgi:ABC-type amino acid transport substrate-binding protein